MRVVLLSPYHGGSHRAWAEGWARESRHDIRILSLPAQFWKWRLHGGAVRLADRFLGEVDALDVLVTTDMLDLATFLALARERCRSAGVLYYAHENQWTYPLPADPTTGPMRRQKGERDRHYAWINVTSMLAADRVAFNSRFHRDEFLGALPAFLRHYPDEKDMGWVDRIAEKAHVIPPGVDLARFGSRQEAGPTARNTADVAAPLLLWNHRWEYDKDPEAFFAAVDALAARGVDFRLAVAGSNCRTRTPEFDRAAERHARRIVHWGPADEPRYRALLRSADVVVSTARHEFFGIAACEAIYCGAIPVLPRRLGYPELIPEDLHDQVLYREGELVDRLVRVVNEGRDWGELRRRLRAAMAAHDWSRRAGEYDDLLDAWFGRDAGG